MAKNELAEGLEKVQIRENSRFDGEIFTFSVGPEKRKVSAHERILSQSPILKAFCGPHFKEGLTKQVELPEDDFDTFNLFLEYLYTGTLKSSGATMPEKMDEWASLYITADKYQLSKLKREILKKLDVTPLHARPIVYLKWIHEVYTNVPEWETEIKDFFVKVSPLIKQHDMLPNDIKELDRLVEVGQRFAVDLVRLLYVSEAKPFNQLREKDLELEALKAKVKELDTLKAKAKQNKALHDKYHRDFRNCTCKDNF